MAQRFDSNPGYLNKEVSTEDIIPGTHKSGISGSDDKLTLGQLQCIPIASCTTANSVAAKTATVINDSLFANNFSIQHVLERNGQTLTEYLVGMEIKVLFSYANTADAPTLNIGNTGALPIIVNGVRMQSGALAAGNYKFRLVPYSSGYAWECEDNGGIVSIIDGAITYSNGKIAWADTKINDALANFDKVITETDANNCLGDETKEVRYFLNTNASNLPSSLPTSNIFIDVNHIKLPSGNRNIFQTLYIWNANNIQKMYTRTVLGSGSSYTYSEWKKIISETDLNNELTTKTLYRIGLVNKTNTKTLQNDHAYLLIGNAHPTTFGNNGIVLIITYNNTVITKIDLSGTLSSLINVNGLDINISDSAVTGNWLLFDMGIRF